MQLLFNKIYLKADHLFKGERARIELSPRIIGGILAGGFRQEANGFIPLAPIRKADSYQELVDEQFGGDHNQFFRLLLSHPTHQRMTIYCDIPSMIDIASRFWKMLYPNINGADYFRLVNFMLSGLYEVLATHRSIHSQLTPAQAAELRNDIDAVFQAEEELIEAWATVVPYATDRNQRESVLKGLGLEMHLATILTVPTWRHSSSVQKRAVDMMYKQVLSEFVRDVKFLLLNNLENIQMFDPQTSYNAETTTLEQFVIDHPRYAFLADPTFLPDNYRYIIRTYDLDDLEQIRKAVLVYDTLTDVGLSAPLKSNLTFQDILDLEEIGSAGRVLGYVDEYREKVNSFMIDYILTHYLSGDTAALQPYIMR